MEDFVRGTTKQKKNIIHWMINSFHRKKIHVARTKLIYKESFWYKFKRKKDWSSPSTIATAKHYHHYQWWIYACNLQSCLTNFVLLDYLGLAYVTNTLFGRKFWFKINLPKKQKSLSHPVQPKPILTDPKTKQEGTSWDELRSTSGWGS